MGYRANNASISALPPLAAAACQSTLNLRAGHRIGITEADIAGLIEEAHAISSTEGE